MWKLLVLWWLATVLGLHGAELPLDFLESTGEARAVLAEGAEGADLVAERFDNDECRVE